MAKRTGAVIIPCITCTDKQWVANSWDKFRIPKPFSKIIVNYGEAIEIDPDVPVDHYQALLKERMNALEAETPALFNRWDTLSSRNWPRDRNARCCE